jgi:hypothetical protein
VLLTWANLPISLDWGKLVKPCRAQRTHYFFLMLVSGTKDC